MKVSIAIPLTLVGSICFFMSNIALADNHAYAKRQGVISGTLETSDRFINDTGKTAGKAVRKTSKTTGRAVQETGQSVDRVLFGE